MSWLTAELRDLWQASTAAATAADNAGRLPLSEVLESITEAMPGSGASTLAGVLALAWEQKLATWSDSAGRYATGLHLLSGDYATEDEQAASRLSEPAPPVWT